MKRVTAVVASLDSAIDRYDTMNRFPMMLQQMGYGADDANAAVQRLSDGVQGLPTTLDSVVSTAQRLTVLTGNLDQSVDTTLALNNAFLASGAGADALRAAWSNTSRCFHAAKWIWRAGAPYRKPWGLR